MEIKTITCPNCGANTTNAQNCEYCGSLLVRFVDKGIDLSKTSYTNDSATLPGLTAELKRNLKLQEDYPEDYVTTDLWYQNETGASEGVCINDNGSDSGLSIVLGFQTYINGSDQQYNECIEKRIETFKNLDCFSLFTSRIFNSVDTSGYERYCREYTIDFGNDADGAARLVSEIMQKVYGWTMDTNFDMFTEVGDDIKKARNSWEKAHGFMVNDSVNNSSDNSNDSETSLLEDYWWVIVGLIGWFLIKMIF